MKIKILTEGAKVPTRETAHSAGFDLVIPKRTNIPHGRSIVPLGFAVELPENIGMFIFARSGVSAKGMPMMYTDKRGNAFVLLGLVDADYRGQVGILVYNEGEEFTMEAQSSVAQAVFLPYYAPVFEVVDELSDTQRGKQGFKS